jgi:spermidine synthase
VAAVHPRTRAIALDVTAADELDSAIAEHDVVVSLVPYTYHADVIRSAIKSKTHVVTTSYVSPAMKQLDAAAKDAGITVLNEVGLDPGIDHLYAVKVIGEVHDKGGKVRTPPPILLCLHSAQLCAAMLKYSSGQGVPLILRRPTSTRGVG